MLPLATHCHTFFTSTHSTSCYSSSKFWLLSNITKYFCTWYTNNMYVYACTHTHTHTHTHTEPGANHQQVLTQASHMLKERYNIHQTTLQVEDFHPTMDECGKCQKKAKTKSKLLPCWPWRGVTVVVYVYLCPTIECVTSGCCHGYSHVAL